MVVTPLNAIIEEQHKRFGDSCILVDEQLIHELEQDIASRSVKLLREGRFQFLLGHPEKLVNPVLRRTIMSAQVARKVISLDFWCSSCFT